MREAGKYYFDTIDSCVGHPLARRFFRDYLGITEIYNNNIKKNLSQYTDEFVYAIHLALDIDSTVSFIPDLKGYVSSLGVTDQRKFYLGLAQILDYVKFRRRVKAHESIHLLFSTKVSEILSGNKLQHFILPETFIVENGLQENTKFTCTKSQALSRGYYNHFLFPLSDKGELLFYIDTMPNGKHLVVSHRNYKFYIVDNLGGGAEKYDPFEDLYVHDLGKVSGKYLNRKNMVTKIAFYESCLRFLENLDGRVFGNKADEKRFHELKLDFCDPNGNFSPGKEQEFYSILWQDLEHCKEILRDLEPSDVSHGAVTEPTLMEVGEDSNGFEQLHSRIPEKGSPKLRIVK